MDVLFSPKYRLINLILLFAVILIISTISIRSCKNTNSDLDGITKSGRLRVFTDSSSLGFIVKGDSVYGFQYEIIKHFADSLGLELQITQQNNINEGIEGLLKGDYDIVANFLPNTTEVNKKVLLTTPLFTSRIMLVQQNKHDSVNAVKIRNQLELAKDTIFTTYRSPEIVRLRNLANEIADTIFIFEVRHASQEQLVKFVSNGKIKYTTCPEQFKQKYLLMFPFIDISIPLGFSQEYCWALNPGAKNLQKRLNEFLNDFIGSEAYWDLYRKYY